MSAQATALASIVNLVVAAQKLAATASEVLHADVVALRDALTSIERYRTEMWWLTIEPGQLNELVASLITYLNVFFFSTFMPSCVP